MGLLKHQTNVPITKSNDCFPDVVAVPYRSLELLYITKMMKKIMKITVIRAIVITTMLILYMVTTEKTT